MARIFCANFPSTLRVQWEPIGNFIAMQKPSPIAVVFCFILLILLYFPSTNVVNATEPSEFDNRIRVFLEKYVENKVERAVPALVKMRVSGAAELVKAVAKDFSMSEGMDKKCHNGRYYLLSHYREELAKFRQVFHEQTGGGEHASSSSSDEGLMDEENAQTLGLLLSFVIQLGYTVGNKAMGLENDGPLKKLLELYACLGRMDKDDKGLKVDNIIYLGAQFDYDEREKILQFKFVPAGTDMTGRESNFEMLNVVFGVGRWGETKPVTATIELLEYLLKMQETDEELENIPIGGELVRYLIKSWTQSESGNSHEFKGNAALYQLKRFGHDVGQRLLETTQLNDGFFKLFPEAKHTLVDLIGKLGNEAQEFYQKFGNNDINLLQHRPHIHFEETLPVELKLEKVLLNLIEAKEMVVKWPNELMNMEAKKCSTVISHIVFYENRFHNSYAYKMCRFDKDIREAMDAFYKHVQDHLSNQIDHQEDDQWVDIVRRRKKTLKRSERNHKATTSKREKAVEGITTKLQQLDAENAESDVLKARLHSARAKLMTDSKLNMKKAELTNAEKKVEEFQKECMAQQPFLLEQAKKIAVALLNLDVKAMRLFPAEYNFAAEQHRAKTAEAAQRAAARKAAAAVRSGDGEEVGSSGSGGPRMTDQ